MEGDWEVMAERDGMGMGRGVGCGRTCINLVGRGVTPILTFPHQGGRNFLATGSAD